jgi:phenylpropionate dioxygenase-like ring-hydroxylating dioxygenase large terminal subunit
MLDQCPHRSAKLSIGRIIDNHIQCPFHGFEFDECGKCVLVPETKRAAPTLKTQTFSILERHGFLWIWHGPPADSDCEIPWFEQLVGGKWSYSEQATDWSTHITRCIENQLDYAHLPYVHRDTIGKDVDVTKPVRFETDKDFIRFYPAGDSSRGFVEFRFPNIWMLTIVPGRFAQMMAFVPVSENITRLYLRGYQSFVTLFGIRTIFDMVAAWQSSIILNQDRQVVLSQDPQHALSAKHEVFYQSDTAVKCFRQRWLETQE